jgi:hypothetical protein
MMKKLFVAAALAALVLCPAAAQAQFSIGAQGLYADDANFGAGGRLSYDLSKNFQHIIIIADFGYFWPDDPPTGSLTYYEGNLNVGYISSWRQDVASYAGLGLNVARSEISGSVALDSEETKVGANFFGGIKYFIGNLAPFFEVKFEIEGGEQFVLTVGLDVILGQR